MKMRPAGLEPATYGLEIRCRDEQPSAPQHSGWGIVGGAAFCLPPKTGGTWHAVRKATRLGVRVEMGMEEK